MLFGFKNLNLLHIRPLMQLFYRYQLENVERSLVENLQAVLDSQKFTTGESQTTAPQGPSEDEVREMKLQVCFTGGSIRLGCLSSYYYKCWC
jgi:hypothetical protein